MPISYRIYTIGRGGHFLGCPEVVECCDDKEAVEKAMQLASGFDVEIWDHKRLVTPLPWHSTSVPCTQAYLIDLKTGKVLGAREN